MKAKHLKTHEVTIERVKQEYARLAFLDIRKAFDENGNLKLVHELDDDTAAAIAGLDVEELWEGRGEDRENIGRLRKIKLSDKRGALDSLATHLGMFVERHEHTGKDGGPIVTEDRTLLETARRIAFLLSQATRSPKSDS
ncbi:terminase small subunit [bacterium]|nr:terminase small subunit [bacterium]